MSDAPSFPLVWIEWEDATLLEGWKTKEEIAEDDGCAKVVTVGFVVRETKETLYVAHSFNSTDSAGVITLPKGWITRRESMQTPVFVAIDARLEDLRHG